MTLNILHFGIEPYDSILNKMQAFTRQRDSTTVDQLWLLQHQPVYTQGVAGKPQHIKKHNHIPIIQTDRGGQITYHAPGQLTGYLLLDLKRRRLGVRQLVTLIENSLIELLTLWGIKGYATPTAPGIYLSASHGQYIHHKIAAIGLRVSRGCSYHGFNLNVDMNMQPWQDINPCGLNVAVTQMVTHLTEQQTSLLNIHDISALYETIIQQHLLNTYP